MNFGAFKAQCPLAMRPRAMRPTLTSEALAWTKKMLAIASGESRRRETGGKAAGVRLRRRQITSERALRGVRPLLLSVRGPMLKGHGSKLQSASPTVVVAIW